MPSGILQKKVKYSVRNNIPFVTLLNLKFTHSLTINPNKRDQTFILLSTSLHFSVAAAIVSLALEINSCCSSTRKKSHAENTSAKAFPHFPHPFHTTPEESEDKALFLN